MKFSWLVWLEAYTPVGYYVFSDKPDSPGRSRSFVCFFGLGIPAGADRLHLFCLRTICHLPLPCSVDSRGVHWGIGQIILPVNFSTGLPLQQHGKINPLIRSIQIQTKLEFWVRAIAYDFAVIHIDNTVLVDVFVKQVTFCGVPKAANGSTFCRLPPEHCLSFAVPMPNLHRFG